MARRREFNLDEAVDRAMHLFWRQGYEATTVRDLQVAMGISSSSLYEAIGDKRAVYLAALARFCALEQANIQALAAAAPTPRALVEHLFASVETLVADEGAARGSLAFNAMVEFGTRDEAVTRVLVEHYFAIAEIIAAVLRRHDVAERHAAALAHTLLSALQGLATLGRVKPDFDYHADVTRLLVSLLDQAPLNHG